MQQLLALKFNQFLQAIAATSLDAWPLDEVMFHTTGSILILSLL